MKFEKNVGAQDKKARLALAGVLIVVGLFVDLGALESLMWLVMVVLIATSFMGVCPAYCLLGKNSCGEGSGCGANKSCNKEDRLEKNEAE